MDHTTQIAWIIDDDDVYKFGFRKYVELKELCAEVVEFSNGIDAINFLSDTANATSLPDIIFLDIDMPVMNGWEFMVAFEKISSRLNKKISIFLVTSGISYEDILQAQNFPDITDYIIKPINSQQFNFAFTGENKKKIA
jgi:two-component SAPR family response regulator